MSSQAPAAASERRIAHRRQPALGTICRLGSQSAGLTHLGLVWNLSVSGVSMLLHEPLQPGTQVRGELATTNDRSTLPVDLRVVHLAKLRTGDYVLGAQFHRPLTTADLQPFVLGPETALQID
jgi:hypothetical protein